MSIIARRIKEQLVVYPFLNNCFGPNVVLIPIPRSSPLKDQNALWPTKRIASALVPFERQLKALDTCRKGLR